jgi:hypothetical protein
MPKWWQVLKEPAGHREPQKETPRFDEIYQSPRVGVTPRSSVGGEFRTPGATPSQSPRPDGQETQRDGTGSLEVSYTGGYLGHLKHGHGVLRMHGCTYEGEFLHDLKHGHGTLGWDDGRQYYGQFQRGKFHGAAIMTWPDGRKYCGQYAEDRKDGDGTFSWQDGRRYQGQWAAGKRHGIGIYTNAKGITGRGLWEVDHPVQWEAQMPLDRDKLADCAAKAQASAIAQAQLHISAPLPLGSRLVGPRGPPAASPRKPSHEDAETSPEPQGGRRQCVVSTL